ncbi:pyruvate dehydrogenase complex dihydrolipoamide acetyltransferase [Opitutus sp. ER46]|uniref:pyruvate dehydrogenase complex dihydrolipoamide acetyltransferase n=1 Tax=Opitutus sp. ER46 TaxID=2161864 RepID=UPI000D31DF78|nr:pyruvate dehydrogenase complex dihydrolipoamide acetyltransferase [Opitutus sp. ER46]PTX91181.1 pyruvate dehydrogenase complex dihydrolipoamide acetyltransferase [Opitutus sp. ER46]
MPNIIEMPKLSDTMTVGTLVKWLKKEGDVVKSGDMLAEVETDKATMELESFFDGTLLKIFSGPGSQVAIGAPLCAIGKPGEKVDVPESKAPAPAAQPAGAPTPVMQQSDQTKVTAPGASTTSKTEVEARPLVQPQTATSASVGQPAPAPARGEDERIRISPLARKLALEKGIDPALVTGSGPGGRIVRADILAAEKQGVTKPAAPAAPAAGGATRQALAPAPVLRGAPIQDERVAAVSNMRGAIARRLLESKTQIPHFYVEVEIDAAPLLALREQLNTALEEEGVKLSVNDFILKGCAEALRRVPQVNASWEPGNGQAQIHYYSAAHVSFAVAMEDGLITPVVRDAHLKSVVQISAEAKSLGKLAKDKKLKPDQFSGGTFCVSNLGMMGIPRFSAIINPPNVAILAVGTTVKKPVVKGDQIVVGQTMVLTLSCDHRVVDGAVGAQFLNALKRLLEAPALLLV